MSKLLPQSICRGQDYKAVGKLGWISSNPQRGLHPPFSDPAKLSKGTNHHKLLCQSSQEPLLLEALHQLTGKKYSRDSSKVKISGVLQPTFLGPKTKQSLETHPRPEQTKSFPQG